MPKLRKKSYSQRKQAISSNKKGRRCDPEYRTSEQASDRAARRRSRQIPEVRTSEQESNTAARRRSRQIPEVRTSEQESDTAARRRSRQIPEVRTSEQESNTAARRRSRQIPEVSTSEQESNTAARRESRENPQKRKREQGVNTTLRKRARLSPTRSNAEKRSRIRRRELQTTEAKQAESERKKQLQKARRARDKCSYSKLLLQYEQRVRCAPSFVCSCCGGLYYEESTKIFTSEDLKNKGCSSDLIDSLLYVDQNIHRLCSTCRASMSRLCRPKMALVNGFDFPQIPEQLQNLSALEERLVAPRLPFMQIRRVGCEQQSTLKGNVVNVENNLDICGRVLPRQFNESKTVQVQLMRKMEFKTPYMYENIRPYYVHRAAHYLVTSDAYQAENVILSDHWKNRDPSDLINFIVEESTVPSTQELLSQGPSSSHAENSLNETLEVEQQSVEEEFDESGADETLIFSEREEMDQLRIRIAPCEGNKPLSLVKDLNAEVLSFPTIYCGIRRQINPDIMEKVSYTDIAKSELRRYDRRACKPSKVLYAFKKSFNEKVAQAMKICLRKKRGASYTAKNMLDTNFVKSVISQDDGYTVFKNIRSSPAYWKEKVKKVLAMIRQLGKPTFFITLSAAETKWEELHSMLYKIAKQLTDIEGIENLSSAEIFELIRNDPVTCIRNFDHRFRSLLNLLLKPEHGIFSPYKLEDFFTRLEFQMRGSPHDHGLYWVKNAPTYISNNEQSIQECENFIDNFITCDRCEGEEDMKQLISFQLHKHSHTCVKGVNKTKCRFGYPLPPLDKTSILTPLSETISNKTKKKAQENFLRLKEYLENNIGRSFKEDMPFDQLIQSLQLSYEDYILAIRSSIKRTTVFLKRCVNATYVNAYNRKLLRAWRANIDIQFIVDPYACAKYCVGYILKSDGGVDLPS